MNQTWFMPMFKTEMIAWTRETKNTDPIFQKWKPINMMVLLWKLKCVSYLIDTGALMSVLNTKIFEKLPPHIKVRLEIFENDLKMVDGRNVKPLGEKAASTCGRPMHIPVIYSGFNWYTYCLGNAFIVNNKCAIDIPNEFLLLKSSSQPSLWYHLYT